MRSVRWPVFVFVLGVAIGAGAWRLCVTTHSPFATHGPSDSSYIAGSNIPDEQAIGGFGKCDNLPKDLGAERWGAAGTVSLVAFPDEPRTDGNRRWFALRLVNRTDEVVPIAACNSHLFLVQEAIDWEGNWRPIERIPQSYCGNSYHRVYLDRDQYWEFPAQHHSGSFKTRLRFRLEQGEWPPRDMGEGMIAEQRKYVFPKRGGRVIHSNEFEGRIDRSSFMNETDE